MRWYVYDVWIHWIGQKSERKKDVVNVVEIKYHIVEDFIWTVCYKLGFIVTMMPGFGFFLFSFQHSLYAVFRNA